MADRAPLRQPATTSMPTPVDVVVRPVLALGGHGKRESDAVGAPKRLTASDPLAFRQVDPRRLET